MLLKAIFSNKIKLKNLIANIMQPPNADNKENIAIFINRIKGEKYLTKKAQAADMRKKRTIKY